MNLNILRSKLKRKKEQISDLTHYSSVDEKETYYHVAIRDNVWLKDDSLDNLTFTRNVNDAKVFRDQNKAIEIAMKIHGKAIEVLVVHYYDEL